MVASKCAARAETPVLFQLHDGPWGGWRHHITVRIYRHVNACRASSREMETSASVGALMVCLVVGIADGDTLTLRSYD